MSTQLKFKKMTKTDKKLNVLSLFDGISTGRLALERAGIEVDTYYASEIDKYAIQVSKKNWPDIIQLGDVKNINGTDLPQIDLLIGGSPCVGFSFAGKQLAFEDPQSKLFFEFVRILKETKPTYFLLENVIMKKQYQDIISKILGVEPILLNSALLATQARRRLYWTNLSTISKIEDRVHNLIDIIDTKYVGKLYDASFFKAGNFIKFLQENPGTICFNYSSSGRGNGIIEGRFSIANKALTLTATGYTQRSMTGVVVDADKGIWRQLSVEEMEQLQTLDVGYTSSISLNQRKRCIGNGWTTSVIEYILKGLK